MVKKIAAALAAAGTFLMFSLAAAATESAVTATVTPKNISVSVAPSSVGYGTVALSAINVTPTGNPTVTATNNGNVTETFNIKGANATEGANTWTLAGVAGASQYVHRFSDATFVTYTAMTTAYQALQVGVVATGTRNFKLNMDTPTSTPSFAQYSTSVTVQATE